MFTIDVVRSEEFLNLPVTCQLLYFHFSMVADDDGFVMNVGRELRFLGFGGKGDLEMLAQKSFIDFTQDGKLIFIVDWLKNNTLRSDRYNPTIHLEGRLELAMKGYKFKNKNFGSGIGIPEVTTGTEKGKEKDIEKDKDIVKGIEEKKEIALDSNALLSQYLDCFVSFAFKNRNKIAAAKQEFIRLPPHQRQEALIGAKNYIKFYQLDSPEDKDGQFSINAANFLSSLAFTQYQQELIPAKEPKGAQPDYENSFVESRAVIDENIDFSKFDGENNSDLPY